MKYGSENILPYNKEEHKGVQVKRMFDDLKEHVRDWDDKDEIRHAIYH